MNGREKRLKKKNKRRGLFCKHPARSMGLPRKKRERIKKKIEREKRKNKKEKERKEHKKKKRKR